MLLTILFAVGLTTAAVWYQLGLSLNPFHMEGGGQREQSGGRIVLLCAVMFLGIIAGRLYHRLPGAGPVSIRDFRQAFADRGMFRALFAAPIVFGIVYSAAAGQPDLVLAAVFAFQNGFCCEVVLGREIASSGASSTGGISRSQGQSDTGGVENSEQSIVKGRTDH